MKIRRRILLILLFLALSPLAMLRSAAADSGATKHRTSREEPSFDQVKASFDRLRSSDPGVADLGGWERLAEKFSHLLNGSPARGTVVEIYCALGDLYAQVYEKRQFTPALSKATYFYEKLSKDFSGDKRVPPRLLRLGDLRRMGLRDETAAKSAYFEIIDRYPSSPEADLARSRVGGEEESAAQPEEKGAPAGTGGDAPEAASAASPAPAPSASPAPHEAKRTLAAAEERPDESKEIFHTESTAKRPIIVIDPGHGGEEVGALGIDGVVEKDVTLAVSELLEELLQQRLRAKTILTRRDDRTLSLADRTKIANEEKADLFISIHANASEYKTAHGIEVYYLDNTDDKSSLKLAERENVSQVQSGNDVAFIISDFIQNAKLAESISLAHHIEDNLVKTVGRYYQDVRPLGVKKAPFYVLVGAHMPCVLAEISFIDHPVEGARLATRRYQRLVALGVYQGVKTYFEARK